jgi:hypothetical protein
MTRHIGAEDLARYRERDLGSRKSARIRAHLAGCPRCVALDEELAGVTAMLASAPAPVMPDQVTARIQAALRAEAAMPVTAAAGTRHETVPPAAAGQHRQSQHAAGGAGSRRHWRLPELRSRLAVRALGVATAAAAVAGGAYGISQLGAAVQSGASTSAGSAGIAAGPLRQTPARLSGPALHYPVAGRQATITPVSSGTHFVQQHLASQVAGTLRRAGPSLPEKQGADISNHRGTRPAPTSSGQRKSFHGIPVSALQGCVTRISAGRRVQLVDVASYQGRQATVIVVAAAGGTGGSRVFVVGPGCSGSDSDLITEASLPGAG